MTGTARDLGNEYSDAEAERRTAEALRRALTTPYKPQRELVGKKRRILSEGKRKLGTLQKRHKKA